MRARNAARVNGAKPPAARVGAASAVLASAERLVAHPVRLGAPPRRGASSCRLRTPGSCRRRRSTCESPSNARMCVAMRSRNQRSCEITSTLPANSSSASSSARSVSTSRSFDGSSSSSTLPPAQQRLGQMQPAALAARQLADDLLLVAALEVEAAEVGARRHLELADGQDVLAAGDRPPRRSCRWSSVVAASGRRTASCTVWPMHDLARCPAFPGR